MFINLIYLIFLIFPLVLGRNVSTTDVVITLVSVLVYLPLHYAVFRANARIGRLCAGVMVLLGLCVMPFNPGANTYIIYGVISATYRMPERSALLFLVCALMLMAAVGLRISYPIEWLVITAIFSIALVAQAIYGQRIEAGTHALHLSQQEVQRLARLAERERISRDLHDVLGHTMSVIVMKSELAHRVLARQPEVAATHMREVEEIARSALQQIRQAVTGMRNIGLTTELEDAQSTLLSAGITLRYSTEPKPISSALETTFALAVREAVTNIIRHANAKNAEIKLQWLADTQQFELHISDDGTGIDGDEKFGNGLNGMRERIELLGGQLAVSPKPQGGTLLQLRCTESPLKLTTEQAI